MDIRMQSIGQGEWEMPLNYQSGVSNRGDAAHLGLAPSVLRISTERHRRSKKKSFAPSGAERVESREELPQQRRWEAFQEMICALRSRALGLAYSVLQNQEDAEDALQNAMLSAYLNLRNFEGRSAFTTWFYRIVTNSALMIRRKRKSSRVDLFPDTGAEEETPWIERIPDLQPDPEMVSTQAEKVRWIDRRLAEMKPALRQAFTLVYYDEFSVKEACSLLGVPATTFKARLFHARRLLIRDTRHSHRSPFRSTAQRRLPACIGPYKSTSARSSSNVAMHHLKSASSA
jgi:RNA polymerase sigma-70 factor (ECF subfamily)